MKILLPSFILFFMTINYQYVHAQKLLSLDEMFKLSESKDQHAFEKSLAAYGYIKVPDSKLPFNVKEMHNYRSKDTFPDGTYCTASWTVFKGQTREYRYVTFDFTNKDHYNNIAKLLLAKGYVPVKQTSKNIGNGFTALFQSVRKDNSGVQLILTDNLTHPLPTPQSEITFTTISTPNWPDDEK